MDYQEILGRRIRNFRKRAGLSQLTLETLIDASPGYLSRVENGELNPTKETLQKIDRALGLNQRESEYLHGNLFYPATEKEIGHAIVEVRDYFNQRGVMAYMLDDRNRFIYMSPAFLKALGFSEEIARKKYFQNWTRIILEDGIGIRENLSKEHYNDMLFNILERFYRDVYFMQDEENCMETLKSIKAHSGANMVWEEILKNPPLIRTIEHRTVYFKFHDIDIPLTYSVESLMNNRRFEVVEYVPTNLLLRLLNKII